MCIVLQGFELDINSVKLCIAICFFPSQHYIWETSCWCLWLRSVYFHCSGVSLYKLIVIHLCILLSMVI